MYWGGGTLRINACGGGKEVGLSRGDARCYDAASTKASAPQGVPKPGCSFPVLNWGKVLSFHASTLPCHRMWATPEKEDVVLGKALFFSRGLLPAACPWLGEHLTHLLN